MYSKRGREHPGRTTMRASTTRCIRGPSSRVFQSRFEVSDRAHGEIMYTKFINDCQMVTPKCKDKTNGRRFAIEIRGVSRNVLTMNRLKLMRYSISFPCFVINLVVLGLLGLIPKLQISTCNNTKNLTKPLLQIARQFIGLTLTGKRD